MGTVAMSGNDTITINGTIFSDLADDNVVELTFPTDIANVKTGKNGNSIYGLNESGKQCEVKMRLVRGSTNDKFMNGLLSSQNQGFASFTLMTGQFVKKIGDGAGKITADTYVLSGGVFTKQVEAKSNVTGETEQSIAIYTMKFSNAPRAIG